MDKETEKRKECTGCGGTGWVFLETDGGHGTAMCPVCKGDGTIPEHLKLYAFYNLSREGVFKVQTKAPENKQTRLRFPDDYAIEIVVQAETLREAVERAASKGLHFSTFTIVEHPSGELTGPPGAVNCVEM